MRTPRSRAHGPDDRRDLRDRPSGCLYGPLAASFRRYEPSIADSRPQAGYLGAYVYEAHATEHGEGFFIRARAANRNRYALLKTATGEIVRTGSYGGSPCRW